MAEDVLTFEELRRAQSRERDTDTLQELDDGFLERARSYLELKRGGEDHLENQEYRNARNILQDIVDRRQKKIVKLAFLSVKSNVNVDNLMAHEEALFRELTDIIGAHRFDVEDDLVDGETEPGTEEPVGEDDPGQEETDAEDAEPEEDMADETDEEPEEEDGSDSADAEEPEEDEPGAGGPDAADGADQEPDDDTGSGETLILGGEPDVPEKDADATTTDPGVSAEEDAEDDADGGAAEDDADAEAADGAEDADVPDGMAKVVITADVPEFMGTDLEAYGPFAEGEEAVVPAQNAEVLEEQGKAEPV